MLLSYNQSSDTTASVFAVESRVYSLTVQKGFLEGTVNLQPSHSTDPPVSGIALTMKKPSLLQDLIIAAGSSIHNVLYFFAGSWNKF